MRKKKKERKERNKEINNGNENGLALLMHIK